MNPADVRKAELRTKKAELHALVVFALLFGKGMVWLSGCVMHNPFARFLATVIAIATFIAYWDRTTNQDQAGGEQG